MGWREALRQYDVLPFHDIGRRDLRNDLIFEMGQYVQLYTIALVRQGSCPDTVFLELQILLVERFKGNIRVLGELLQEEPFPLLRLTLQLKAPLELLLLLSLPIGVIGLNVISAPLIVFVYGHSIAFLSSGRVVAVLK